MRSSIKQGESVLVLGIAAALIALGIAGLGVFLNQVGHVEDGVAHAEALDLNNGALSDEISAPAGLSIKVDTRGLNLPADAVSAQYAVAVASDIAEHVFDQVPTERAYVSLLDGSVNFAKNYGLEGYVWNVQLQTESGVVIVDINASTGIDFHTNLMKSQIDWNWFDAWNEEAAEQERLADEELNRQIQENPEAFGITISEPMSDEELHAVHEQKRAGMLEFADSVATYPQGDAAVEYTNALDLGKGALATAGRIMMAGDSMGFSSYVVEVALDDGTYLYANIAQEPNPDTSTYDLVGYQRSDTDYATFAYGW